MNRSWVLLFGVVISFLCGRGVWREASAGAGCRWDGLGYAFFERCGGTWTDFDVIKSVGCNDNCSVYVEGQFETPLGGDWVVCEDGAVIDSGSGWFEFNDFFYVGCGERMDIRFNNDCDSTSSGDPCEPNGGFLEFLLQGTCEEC